MISSSICTVEYNLHQRASAGLWRASVVWVLLRSVMGVVGTSNIILQRCSATVFLHSTMVMPPSYIATEIKGWLMCPVQKNMHLTLVLQLEDVQGTQRPNAKQLFMDFQVARFLIKVQYKSKKLSAAFLSFVTRKCLWNTFKCIHYLYVCLSFIFHTRVGTAQSRSPLLSDQLKDQMVLLKPAVVMETTSRRLLIDLTSVPLMLVLRRCETQSITRNI